MGGQTAVHIVQTGGGPSSVGRMQATKNFPGSVKSSPDKGKVLVQAMGAYKPIELRISLDSSLDSWGDAATYL